MAATLFTTTELRYISEIRLVARRSESRAQQRRLRSPLPRGAVTEPGVAAFCLAGGRIRRRAESARQPARNSATLAAALRFQAHTQTPDPGGASCVQCLPPRLLPVRRSDTNASQHTRSGGSLLAVSEETALWRQGCLLAPVPSRCTAPLYPCRSLHSRPLRHRQRMERLGELETFNTICLKVSL